MNPSTIYSKSGKGVQEASGKTSLLKRQDRAVLSAIDGRATLGEVAQKVGKSFDAEFEKLIRQLDKDGFVREVTAGAAASGSRPAAPAAKAPPPKAPAPSGGGGGGADLDFTSIMPAIKPGTPRPAPKPAAPPPPPTPKPAPASPAAEQRAKEQEAALFKARQEAEARAQADRDRARLEIEAKARAEAEAMIRAETEKKLRDEVENKARAEAEAKAKAARDLTDRLAAEAKAKAEAAAQAKIDAERKALEDVERKARAEAEKARKEADELRQRLEEERKAREAEEERRRKDEEERRAREESERKAREEADRKRREEEEQRRRQEEEERRAREEAERRAREEAERKRLEEEERRRKDEEQRREREEIERLAREAAEAKRREEEDRRLKEKEEQARRVREEDEAKKRREEEARTLKAREEEEERARKALDETRARIPTLDFGALSQEVKVAAGKERAPEPEPESAPAPAPAKPAGPGSLDSLMADLDSFSQREEDERKTREEADRKSKEEKRRRVQEEADRCAKEQAERERREAEDRRRREEEERRAREDQERRQREEEERLRAESEERRRKQHEAMAAAQVTEPVQGTPAGQPAGRQAPLDDIAITPEDLDMDDVKQDEAVVAKDARKAQREKEREARQREKEARERAKQQQREAKERDAEPVQYSRPRRKAKWGKPVAITLFVLLLAGVGYVHVMPLPLPDYEQAASAALGRPVRISSGRLSLFTGVTLNLDGVRIGDGVRIAHVRAFPAIGSLFDERKVFNRIELDGITLPQEALGETLFAKATSENFRVNRVVVKELKLDGPLPLPTLEADAVVGPDGGFRTVTLRGPEALVARLTPGADNVEFDATASSLTLPFAPEVHLNSFAMKGTATRQGLSIASWGGSVLDGALSGTANVRWGGTWQIDGVVQVRNINAAVFAPALLSEGKADVPAGRFSFSGPDPAKLSNGARLEGNFTVQRGVLGSFDLSRAIRTGGREFAGRTQFLEMTGQGIYDRGAVQVRNINVTAGALNASATLDVASGGRLDGRIVADIKTSAGHAMRATLTLGGTVKEPQVRN